MKITVESGKRITNKKQLRKLAEKILRAHDQPDSAEMGILICGDEYIRELNRSYRGIDSATDVITFALNDRSDDDFCFEADKRLLGDIVISIDTARRQARALKHPLNVELLHLVCHGVLHLLGYDHIDARDRKKMFSAHSKMIAGFFAEAGLQEYINDTWLMEDKDI